MDNVISFDSERASRYILEGLLGFMDDPADTDYQRGFLAALLAVYREGLGKGLNDDRLRLLERQC